MVLDGMLSTGSDRLIDRRVFYCRETLPITLAGATVEMGSSAKIYKTEISVDSIRNIDKYLTTATMIINIPILSTYIIIYIHDIRGGGGGKELSSISPLTLDHNFNFSLG